MILLTGATGFLGSRLLVQLLQRGDHIVAAKRTTSSLSRIQHRIRHPSWHLLDRGTTRIDRCCAVSPRGREL